MARKAETFRPPPEASKLVNSTNTRQLIGEYEGFTDFERRFVENLLADPMMNASRAAKKAGTTSVEPNTIAHQTLMRPKVAALVSKKITERSQRLNISSDMVLQGLYRIATADIADAHDWDGNLKNIHDIPPELRQALDGIDSFKSFLGNQETGVTRKIRLSDRLKAWELLGKHLAMFTDKFAVRTIKTIEDLTPEEQLSLMKDLEEKLGTTL